MSEYVSLGEFVSVDEPGAEPLAGDSDNGAAIPAGGLVVVYGNGGAGKTTLLIDGAFHLAAGVDWLGVSPSRPLNIVWIENEGPRPEFRKKLREKVETWSGSDVRRSIHLHEDPWGAFTFRDELCRQRLAQRIRDTEADLLIAGPVKEIGMQGAGTDDDISDFLADVNQVRRETGVAVVLIHHENRAGQISGAWESRPDTLIHVQAQGNGRTRMFWQKCRWSSALHQTSANLLWADGAGFTLEEKPAISEDTIEAELLQAVHEHAGESWTQLRKHIRGNETEKAKVRDRLLNARTIINAAPRPDQFKLWHTDDPAAPRSEPGTALERPYVPPADGGSGTDRSTVPAFYRNGGGTERPPASTDAVADDFEVTGIA